MQTRVERKVEERKFLEDWVARPLPPLHGVQVKRRVSFGSAGLTKVSQRVTLEEPLEGGRAVLHSP